MKALLIFLFASVTAGDKLNPAYLPPPGANYSGGGGDNEVPFEVPVGNFGLKDESATRLTPGIFREGGVTSSPRPKSNGEITPSIYSTSSYAPISDGKIASTTYAPNSDARFIPSSSYTVDGQIIPSTYAPPSNGRITASNYAPVSNGRIPSSLTSTSGGRLIPSTFSPPFNGRLPTSTYSPYSDGNIISPSYKPFADGRIVSPTSYAPTTTYNSYSTTPVPYAQSFDRVTDDSSNRPNEENNNLPNQYSKGVNTNLSVSNKNQFDNDDYNSRQPVSFGPSRATTYNDGVNSSVNNKQIGTARYPERKVRPQEEAERNAVILNNENIITPDGYFAYSFDTSNGIHADESGTASDGVKANGSYSYIGDDGKLYNVTYSANEYGFQPRGDHLPTPPPVPDAILKVIEQAAKDRDNGIFDDGSYDERKYGFKQYQPFRDRIMGNNGLQKESSLPLSNISNRTTISHTAGVVSPISQEDGYYNTNQKGIDVIGPNKLTKESPYEVTRKNNKNNDEYNEKSQILDSPNTVRIPGNKITNYNNARDKNYNTPLSENDDDKNHNYYDDYRLSNPRARIVSNNRKQNINIPDFEKSFKGKQNGYSYPNPNLQFGERIPNEPSRFDQNQNDPADPRNTNELATSRPTKYYDPNTRKIEDLGANADSIKDFTDSPSSTENVRDFTAFTDQPRDYDSPSTTAKFNGLRNYYRPSSVGTSSTERIKPSGPLTRPSTYYNRPSTIKIEQFGANRPENNYYNPTSTVSVSEFRTYTDKPGDYNTGVVGQFDTTTGRPSTFYGPSSTDSKFSTTVGRPKDVYSSSLQEKNDFDQASGRPSEYNSLPTQRKDVGTDRPNTYYSPMSTERRKGLPATNRPGTNFVPSSTGRLRPTSSFTRTNYNTPSSTIGTNNIGTYNIRPTSYRYRPTSTERINEVNTITGKPNDYSEPAGSSYQLNNYRPTSTKQTFTDLPSSYYGPSSTERIKYFDTVTGRPVDYNVPSSTQKVKDFDTATGRPVYYYGPSTEISKDFDVATGKPTYYGPSSTQRINYGPSSTERIKYFDTVTGQPVDYNVPSLTQKVKGFDTATGRPVYYNVPSSTQTVKDFDTATGRPVYYNVPSSTQTVKDFDTATGRPIYYNVPSSTQTVKDFDTATGKPIDFYRPSSTERITDLVPATGRPSEYYSPSTTESIKDFGRPTEYYSASSTERITGEDFSGPKQPQRYDPETGYHY